MEQYHRQLINNCMSDLIAVTSDLQTIVNNLLEKNIINEWMKNYILVRFLPNFNSLIVLLFHAYRYYI